MLRVTAAEQIMKSLAMHSVLWHGRLQRSRSIEHLMCVTYTPALQPATVVQAIPYSRTTGQLAAQQQCHCLVGNRYICAAPVNAACITGGGRQLLAVTVPNLPQ